MKRKISKQILLAVAILSVLMALFACDLTIKWKYSYYGMINPTFVQLDNIDSEVGYESEDLQISNFMDCTVDRIEYVITTDSVNGSYDNSDDTPAYSESAGFDIGTGYTVLVSSTSTTKYILSGDFIRLTIGTDSSYGIYNSNLATLESKIWLYIRNTKGEYCVCSFGYEEASDYILNLTTE